MIRLEAVRRVYGEGANACVALRDVTLQVPAGSFTALAGPSGSGKTSLLQIIGALDTPTAGRVEVDGRALAGLADAALAELRLRRIGFVFQDAQLIPVLSIRENVEFPLLFRRDLDAAARTRRAGAMIERVGLAPIAHRRPDEISGGERQRAALARALAGGPALVLADEPTANLDQQTGIGVITLMHELNRDAGTTFLYATHDPQLVALADRTLHLRDGALQSETAA